MRQRQPRQPTHDYALTLKGCHVGRCEVLMQEDDRVARLGVSQAEHETQPAVYVPLPPGCCFRRRLLCCLLLTPGDDHHEGKRATRR